MARPAQFQADFSDEEDTHFPRPQSDSESEPKPETNEDVEESTGFAQFVDSEDDDGASDSDDDSDSDMLPPKRQTKGKGKRSASSSSDEEEETELKQSLASIPFGDLLKAQEKLSKKNSKGQSKRKRQKQDLSGPESENEGMDGPVTQNGARGEVKKKPSMRDLMARNGKNAPTEESSSRPVSRRRQVVDVPKLNRRDPRFSAVSGHAKKNEYQAQYGFLTNVYSNELKTLKEQYVALLKKERGAGGNQAEAFAEERELVGRALNRAQALAAERRRRDEADQLETDLRRQNRQRVAEGKKEFYLKKSEKKQLLLRKRFERLASTSDGSDPTLTEGSNSKQLRKTLERRRKRNAAKERKALPFVADPRRAGTKPKRTE